MIDMLVKLYELQPLNPVVDELKREGIVVRRAMPFSDKTQLIQWVRGIWGGGWADECDVAFSNHPASCFVAVKDQKLLGFGCYDTCQKNFFGPTGVHDDAKGKGVGKALLLACLHAMRWNGYAYAIIGGVGPKEFYSKVAGATVIEGSDPGIFRDLLRTTSEGSSS